jgi:hypothetical protein
MVASLTRVPILGHSAYSPTPWSTPYVSITATISRVSGRAIRYFAVAANNIPHTNPQDNKKVARKKLAFRATNTRPVESGGHGKFV